MSRAETAPGGSEGDLLLERPLAARSLVASLLLRSRPPRMRGARMVQWCGLFGVSEGTARVALSRMVDRGELRAVDGVYELAGRVQSRRVAQDWSLDPELSPWDGTWELAIVAPAPREASERIALRDSMRRLRFVAPREGIWTRPDNLPRASAPAESWLVADAQCVWWSGRPDEDPRELVDLFDGSAWSARARMLTDRLDSVTRALVRDDERALADGFVTGAAALAHIRSDPLLPTELASDAPIGLALRLGYRNYEETFARSLHVWFRQA